MDCCIGRVRVKCGTNDVGEPLINWYVPNGKTSQEFTYCQYCYDNGCCKKEDVTKLTEQVGDCNCDCEKQKDHLRLVPLVCRACNFDVYCSPAIVGQCQNCEMKTGTGNGSTKYCDACTYSLKKCKYCGDIKDGNTYVEIIKDSVDEIIAYYQKKIKSDDDTDKVINSNKRYIGMIEYYTKKYEDFKKDYAGKTKDDIMDLIIKQQRMVLDVEPK